MTISIQFNSPEELKLVEPFLAQFRDFVGVNIQLVPAQTPAKRRKKTNAGIADKLHGVLQLPEGFDYKSFLADGYLTSPRLPF